MPDTLCPGSNIAEKGRAGVGAVAARKLAHSIRLQGQWSAASYGKKICARQQQPC